MRPNPYRTLKGFLIGAGIAVAFWQTAFAEVSFPILLAPAPSAFEFSDLDFRDAQNQPIHSREQKARLRRAIVQSVHELIITNMTPSKRWLMTQLQMTWKLGFPAFARMQDQLVEKWTFWIKKKKILAHQMMTDVGSVSTFTVDRGRVESAAQTRFLYFLSSLLSSTQILR